MGDFAELDGDFTAVLVAPGLLSSLGAGLLLPGLDEAANCLLTEFLMSFASLTRDGDLLVTLGLGFGADNGALLNGLAVGLGFSDGLDVAGLVELEVFVDGGTFGFADNGLEVAPGFVVAELGLVTAELGLVVAELGLVVAELGLDTDVSGLL